MADNEHQDTYAIRESLFVCREKARNVVKAQQDRTEHIIRKRIFETKRAKNELEWQLKKVNIVMGIPPFVSINLLRSYHVSDARRNGKVPSRNSNAGGGS